MVLQEGLVVCPSGLVGRVRGWKTRDARMLADPELVRAGKALDRMLAACWLETIDPGPCGKMGAIQGEPIAADVWPQMLVCDRFWAMMQIRRLTFGAYAFDAICPRDTCKAVIPWEVDLDKLPVRPVPDAIRDGLREHGNALPGAFSDGTGFRYQVLTGAAEGAIARLAESGATSVSDVGAIRIVSIDGCGGTLEERVAWLDELPFAEWPAIGDLFSEIDGGVETSIEVECPGCKAIVPVALPLDRAFAEPKKARNGTK